METAAFSTGISVQWPSSSAAQSYTAGHDEISSSVPFPYSPDTHGAQKLSERRREQEAYNACQELAYHFACEKTRAAVQAVLHKANSTCYDQVLRFFERYRTGEAAASTAPVISISPSSGRRRFDPSAPVCFPGFHAIPTAAVIAGADVMASDLWVEPLTLTLQRAFPLCLVAPRDAPNARKLVEWLCARLEVLCDAQQREKQWVKAQLDGFDLLPLNRPPVDTHSQRQTRRQKAISQKQQTQGGTVKLLEEQQRQVELLEEYGDADSDAYVQGGGESSDSDPESFSTKRKRRRKPREKSVNYSRWTMTRLLTTIQANIKTLLGTANSSECHELLDGLRDMVLDQLQCAVDKVKEQHGQQDDHALIVRLLACYEKAVGWLRRRLVSCRDVAAPLTNAMAGSARVSVYVGSTELQLAQVLHQVLQKYVKFLDDYMEVCVQNRSFIATRQRNVRMAQRQHQDIYQLGRIASEEASPRASSSFLLLCIEQLEAFPQHVLRDFLAIWTHFLRQEHDRQGSDPGAVCTLGLVAGVATAASPALRRLDLAVSSQLELQFFSLVDSHKCFDDVLESLVVDANLPLALDGHVLRVMAARHRRIPSVPKLLLALRLLLFSHLRRCRWSFLALAMSTSGSVFSPSPLVAAAEVARLPPTHRVSVWLRRHSRQSTPESTVDQNSPSFAWLTPFSDHQLADLAACISPSRRTADKWRSRLDAALEDARHRRERWKMGWRCLRAACAWLDVPLPSSSDQDATEEDVDAVELLALALDGHLARSSCFEKVIRALRFVPRDRLWDVLANMLDDWRACYRTAATAFKQNDQLAGKLEELQLLCQYAVLTRPPEKMETALRQEICDVFTDELIAALVQPARASSDSWSSADALVNTWVVLADADVLDKRLRFNYHDELLEVLRAAAMDDYEMENDGEASWARDVGLAFLFYQETTSSRLSLSEWYASFASELEEQEEEVAAKKRKKMRSTQTARKARFLRAYCTLRHWGFLKSDAPRDREQDVVEKLVFI